LGLGFGFRFDFGFRVLGDVTRTLRLYHIVLVARPIQPIDSPNGKTTPTVLYPVKAK